MGEFDGPKKHDRENWYCKVIRALFKWRNSDRFLYQNGNRKFYMKEIVKTACGEPTAFRVWFLEFDVMNGALLDPQIIPIKSMSKRRATFLNGQTVTPGLVL